MTTLEIRSPGLLTTIQDAGRPGLGHLGVPISGACDPWALAVANLLLGNPVDVPALELTLLGPELRVLEGGTVSLAGADLGANLDDGGGRLVDLEPDAVHELPAGSSLRFRGPRWGVRAYLGLPGGVEAPRVLGSASAYLPARLGGLDGRPLVGGDRVHGGRSVPQRPGAPRWPLSLEQPGRSAPATVRVVPGPHPDRFGRDALEALCDAAWQVHPHSDRMALRLAGPRPTLAADGTRLLSQGMLWGAIQVAGEGQPIVLLADHQTVGGYPVLAVAIGADLPVLGQLGPGDEVRFTLTDLDTARAAQRARRDALAAGAAALAGPAGP